MPNVKTTPVMADPKKAAAQIERAVASVKRAAAASKVSNATHEPEHVDAPKQSHHNK